MNRSRIILKCLFSCFETVPKFYPANRTTGDTMYAHQMEPDHGLGYFDNGDSGIQDRHSFRTILNALAEPGKIVDIVLTHKTFATAILRTTCLEMGSIP